MPKGDVPGEWYSPTQPFPVKPPPLVRNSFNKEEDFIRASDTTPEHVKACEEMWDKAGGFINQGPFTPFGFHEAGAPPRVTYSFPASAVPTGVARRPTRPRATSMSALMIPRSPVGSKRRSPAAIMAI